MLIWPCPWLIVIPMLCWRRLGWPNEHWISVVHPRPDDHCPRRTPTCKAKRSPKKNTRTPKGTTTLWLPDYNRKATTGRPPIPTETRAGSRPTLQAVSEEVRHIWHENALLPHFLDTVIGRIRLQRPNQLM
jgi:hypothetical protein